MKLRPYQDDLINKIKIKLKNGYKSVVAVLGCGGGKSVIQANIAKTATEKGNTVLFLVHRKELCQQIADTFVKCGVDLKLCDIEMVQTISRRIGKTSRNYQLIITDECHHSLSGSYRKIYDYYINAVKLGFTATPCRLDKVGLGEIYDAIVEGVSTQWLIDNNFLSPYTYYGVKIVDTDNLKVRAGEFAATDVNELMEQNVIYGEAFKNWHKLANGKKTIIYCASIKSSIETVKKFKENGIKAEHLDGTTPSLVRRKVIKDFRDGKITVLSNVDLFGEGFDVPDCECVVLLRPTMSLTLHIQQSMRSMRYQKGKRATIIDHVGNVYRHGLPDDKRDWTLKTKKKKQQSEIKIKQCPVCFGCVSNTVIICPTCGYEFKISQQEKDETKVIDAELLEITPDDLLAISPYDDYKKNKTFDEMERFRKAKKYKFMWTIRKCIELGIAIPPKYQYMARWFIL